MLRFVLLEHDHPQLHWDFLLQTDAPGLLTWRLSGSPLVQDSALTAQIVKIPALQLPPHREIYLDYEGAVSGNRGHVIRKDAGFYIPLYHRQDILELRLEGSVLQGFASLIRQPINPPENAENTNWTFCWIRDCEN